MHRPIGCILHATATLGARAGDGSLRQLCSILGLALALGLLSAEQALALDRTWIGGNADWVDGGSTANWSPADEPDSDDTAIFNTLNAVSLGSTNLISGLTISNGFDLFTGGYELVVTNQSTLIGAGTTIRIDTNTIPSAASFQTPNLDLNGGASMSMNGGIALITSLLEINTGSVLSGFGRVNVGISDLGTVQVFENSGLIQVVGNTSAPQTLTIHANGTILVDTLDLDGDSEAGVIDVDNVLANVNADTLTLVIDGPLADAFSGTLQIGQRDTVTFNDSFTIDSASIILNGGGNTATLNGPAAITSIANSALAITNAATIANDMTFVGTNNTVTTAANSTLTLEGTVAVPDANLFAFGANTLLVVSGATTITDAAGDFNWDGTGIAPTTIQGSGLLTLDVNRVDTTDNVYGGTLNLNDGGDLSVNVAATSWTLANTLNKNGVGTSTVTDDAVNITGVVTVEAGTLSLPSTTLSPGSTVVVNGLLSLGFASVLAGPTSVTGSGTFRLASTSTVTADTTIAANTFDWDGVGVGTLHTINSNVSFTINSPFFDDDGDMDDPINLTGSDATLAINGPASWEMRGAFNANSSGSGIAYISGNSRMSLVGAGAVMTINGQTVANAPLTIGSNSTVNISNSFLRLSGGDLVSSFNTMAGGTINGPGTLDMALARVLRGFGTNNAPIDFNGVGRIYADDGTLTLNGTFADLGTIGTADADGILNVTSAWNSSIAAKVNLTGGELKGGTLTIGNANGVVGHGLLSSRVLNGQKLVASGGTLIVQTAGNDNDWDGAGNNGRLEALGGATLELRDNATFGFTGTAAASGGGSVFASGFALDFNPGSTINLTAGTYHSASSTDIGGAVIINAGGESTIGVQNNFFLTFEPTSVTTLGANLRLTNNNINIEAGATFSGSGAIIIPDGSHLVIDDAANVNALLDLRGAFRPANFEGVGRVDMKDYQQAASGELFVELAGTSLNQYDRLVVNGAAVLDGYLNLDIDGGFVPVVGNTFNIVSASAGITGRFTAADTFGMPPGLTLQLNYLPTVLQIAVVAGGPYETWISLFPSLTNPADRLKNANPDGDELKNLAEFAFDDDPTSGVKSGKIVGKIAPVAGTNVLTLTFPVRIIPGVLPSDPPGNEFVLTDLADGITYTVQAGDELAAFTVNVTEVKGADAVAIQAGLPALHTGWEYRTFRCPNSVVGNPADFIKVAISD